MAINHDTFLFHQWHYIFLIPSLIKIEVGIKILQLVIMRNKKIGRITRALKLPNMPFIVCTPSPPEDYNDELCRKTVVVLT